jgi:hypothetical protein
MQRLLQTSLWSRASVLKDEIRLSLVGLHLGKLEELRLHDTALEKTERRFATSMAQQKNSLASAKESEHRHSQLGYFVAQNSAARPDLSFS